MSKIPVRRDQLRRQLQAFTAWLNANGAEIGIPSNPYEVLRYRAYWRNTRRAAVHIIYAKDNGLLTWTGGSLGHFRAFVDGLSIDRSKTADIKPAKVEGFPPEPVEPVSDAQKRRAKLLARDGSQCWFCGQEMGRDITIEHLIAKSHGGGNALANLVLAHAECNRIAANMSITKKVALRARLQSGLSA